MEKHDAAVKAIEARVRDFHEAQRPFRIFHGSTNSTRPSQRDPATSIDTSQLRNVLQIDKNAKTAIVEPNVPMDDLVLATLKHQLVPLVVMEFPGITAGGGFSGTSGESSSFRHGFFDSTVNWVEIVLARGEIVRASREHLPDLFWGAASSFGTLGVVTCLEVRLRDATSYVGLTYHPFTTMDAALAKIQTDTADPQIDYIDGIVYARDQIVVCSGSLTNELPKSDDGKPTKAQHFTRRWDPWFYLHAQRSTRKHFSKSDASLTPTTIFIPLVDYLFRYDRGGFWVGRYAFKYFLTPFNRVTRGLLDFYLHTRVMYHALHASGQADMYIIQDVAIPYKSATDFHNWLDDNLHIYPIWLCPLRQRREGGSAAQHGLYADLADATQSPEFMLNFGVWGPGSRNRRKFLQQNRVLEGKVGACGGRKWLYAHAYYTEDEFWQIYDRPAYLALREEYGASYLPDVFSKVKVDLLAKGSADFNQRGSGKARRKDIWPLSGLYGVYKAWRGGDYLLRKQALKDLQEVKAD